MKIHIVDYDSGNLESIRNALKKVGCEPVTTNKASELINANAVIFPGQGSFPSAIDKLSQFDITKTLINLINDGVPFLGICLGLQLMFESSEEGNIKGLNLLKGTVPKITNSVKVPHIGWNSVKFGKSHKIFEGIPDDSYFYFLHSYYVKPLESENIIGSTNYGNDFCSAYGLDNYVGVQFHPEKSGNLGLQIFDNFINKFI
ncbi:MAG: imidazole glycerol phosphate synthase subunit HisH [Dehalococcoidia bacterium]